MKLFKSTTENNNGEEMVISIDETKGTGYAEVKMWDVDWDDYFQLDMWEGGNITIDSQFNSIEISGDNGMILFEPLEVVSI
jgi:hypothetical protein